jgi:hypothetical protein
MVGEAFKASGCGLPAEWKERQELLDEFSAL